MEKYSCIDFYMKDSGRFCWGNQKDVTFMYTQESLSFFLTHETNSYTMFGLITKSYSAL